MMGSVRMHLRAQLRSTRFAIMGLIALVGVTGGVVITAAAGARRTDTAFPRLLQASRASDALVSPNLTGTNGFYAAIAKFPEVEATGAEAACLAFARPGHTEQKDLFPGVAGMDDRALNVVERPKLFAGRLPRPERADEALANRKLAIAGNLHIGQRLTLLAIPADFQSALAVHPPTVHLTIVGIGVFPGEVVPSSQLDAFPTLYTTPAYLRAHPEQPGCEGLAVRLRAGRSVEPFRRHVNAIAPRFGSEVGEEVFFQDQRLRNAKVARAIRPQAVALWLFALLTGATFLIVIGQILYRNAALSAASSPSLRALGMTRRQIFASMTLQTALICLAGGLIAVGIAIAASPLMPIGPARIAEPSPGFSIDAGLLSLGFACVSVLLLAVTLIPTWRAALGHGDSPSHGSSRLARAVAESSVPPSTGIGIGMALDPGRGRSAVPVRSAILGAILAVAAGATAVIFGANLDRLVNTPALYGWRWDAIFDTGFGLIPKTDVNRIGSDPAVGALAGGHYGNGNVTVAGRAVPAVGIDILKGDAFPRLTEGRAPRTGDEVVLGVKVARRIGARIGESVEIGGLGTSSTPRSLRVVGIAVFPALGHGSFEPTGLGEGVAVTAGALGGGEAADAYTYAIVGFSPRADVKAAITRLNKGFASLELCRSQLCELLDVPQKPADISNAARARGTPIVLAGAFALLAVATLGHTLVTAVNRRRRDLAVIKTLGFVRRQVSATIAWQAATVALVALVSGIPIGVAAGRWTWRTFADQLGVPFDPRVPVVPFLVAVPATIIVANLIAAIPARTAGRTQPARVLRAE